MKKISNGDILSIKSPVDEVEVLALATVTPGNVGFDVVDEVTLQEEDGIETVASYSMPENLEYDIVANSKTFNTNFPAEYRTVLKHLTVPCGPLTMARIIMRVKEPGVSTDKESIASVIEEAFQKGASRVTVFKAKIDQFTKLAESYNGAADRNSAS